MFKYRFDQFEFSNENRTEFFKRYMSPLSVQIFRDHGSSGINVRRFLSIMNRTVPDFKFTPFNRGFISGWFIKLAFDWINFFSNRSGWFTSISIKLFSIAWTACMIVFIRFTKTHGQIIRENRTLLDQLLLLKPHFIISILIFPIISPPVGIFVDIRLWSPAHGFIKDSSTILELLKPLMFEKWSLVFSANLTL